MMVISKGIYKGLAVDAVRYPYYQVAFRRPEIIKYFALPYGYRFYKTDNEQDIWFDEDSLE